MSFTIEIREGSISRELEVLVVPLLLRSNQALDDCSDRWVQHRGADELHALSRKEVREHVDARDESNFDARSSSERHDGNVGHRLAARRERVRAEGVELNLNRAAARPDSGQLGEGLLVPAVV